MPWVNGTRAWWLRSNERGWHPSYLFEDIDSTGPERLSIICARANLFWYQSRRWLLQTHLRNSVFLPSQCSCASSHLRHAAFWLHVRHEIHATCSHQRTLEINLDHRKLESSFESANDNVWPVLLRFRFHDDGQVSISKLLSIPSISSKKQSIRCHKYWSHKPCIETCL